MWIFFLIQALQAFVLPPKGLKNIWTNFLPFLFLPSLPPTTELLKVLNSLAVNPALSLGKFFSSCSPSQQEQHFSVTFTMSVLWSKRWSILKQIEGLSTCELAPVGTWPSKHRSVSQKATTHQLHQHRSAGSLFFTPNFKLWARF